MSASPELGGSSSKTQPKVPGLPAPSGSGSASPQPSASPAGFNFQDSILGKAFKTTGDAFNNGPLAPLGNVVKPVYQAMNNGPMGQIMSMLRGGGNGSGSTPVNPSSMTGAAPTQPANQWASQGNPFLQSLFSRIPGEGGQFGG